jgi:hypothetical protein
VVARAADAGTKASRVKSDSIMAKRPSLKRKVVTNVFLSCEPPTKVVSLETGVHSKSPPCSTQRGLFRQAIGLSRGLQRHRQELRLRRRFRCDRASGIGDRSDPVQCASVQPSVSLCRPLYDPSRRLSRVQFAALGRPCETANSLVTRVDSLARLLPQTDKLYPPRKRLSVDEGRHLPLIAASLYSPVPKS